MALRWFLRAASMQIVAHPSDGGGEETSPSAMAAAAAEKKKRASSVGFQMPLHYPRYRKLDYERMEEWRLDMLLKEYGLPCEGSLQEKRAYAMGAFLWPDQL